jgi:hypothetical protein
MRKVSVLLSSILIFSLIVFLFSSTATTQPPYDLEGQWEVSVTIMGDDWGGDRGIDSVGHGKGVLIICQYDFDEFNPDYTRPNLYVADPNDTGILDPFYGFIQGSLFSLYKENCDNCDEESNLLGREMIIGHIYDDGNKFRGQGMGFDSNFDCGGTWSYPIIAKRIGGLPNGYTCPPRPTSASATCP